ncbi:MAG: pyruvate kinase, partial [Sporichthyaceae bacterium]
MRRAKIVCTLGPATSSTSQVRALVDAGMDVARLNLSHGDYADHEKVYRAVRRASDETGRGVAVLVDLQGPKIRVGTFASGPVMLVNGAEFTITTDDVPGDVHEVGTTYDGLPGDVQPGDRLLIDDGKVALECIKVEGTRVFTKVIEGGRVSNNKGINLPGVAVSVPALSEKDKEDLRWALHLQADLIALSFVRNAGDARDVRDIMDEEGVHLPVLAKIEKPQAVDNLAEIVEAFDGIMVARGDLGVELPLEDVPLVQTQAITLARRAAKPVIVATQMLESMIETSRPTRAEASDVANAVLDGADALMLSGETSVGKFPIVAVETMARIIVKMEENALDSIPPLGGLPRTKGGAITRAAAEVGELLGARFLVAFTQSGDSARRLSRLRSSIPLLAFTPEQAVRSQLSLLWGVEAFLTEYVKHTDDMVRQVDSALLGAGRVAKGDLVVIVAGSPPG